jgi:hypothetical protein
MKTPAIQVKAASHKFVEFIPDELDEGVVYVSTRFATVAHKCFCGCGNEVVTPLSPTDWTLSFDGKSISLDPSVGSWNLPCRSHYWIRRNIVQWAPKWSQREVDAARSTDAKNKRQYFEESWVPAPEIVPTGQRVSPLQGLWRSIRGLWS